MFALRLKAVDVSWMNTLTPSHKTERHVFRAHLLLFRTFLGLFQRSLGINDGLGGLCPVCYEC